MLDGQPVRQYGDTEAQLCGMLWLEHSQFPAGPGTAIQVLPLECRSQTDCSLSQLSARYVYNMYKVDDLQAVGVKRQEADAPSHNRCASLQVTRTVLACHLQ